MQQTGLADQIVRHRRRARDGGQLVIEHADEGEQVVALVLQGHAHLADARRIFRLTLMQFIDERVEQRMTGCQISARQCQDVALQPPGKRAKVVSELMRVCFEATQFGKLGDQQTVLTASTGVGEPDFECCAFRACVAGDACPDADEGFELLMDAEHIAMTRGIRSGELLAGAQTRACVGNRVIGLQSARLKVQQMDGPGVAIAMRFGGQQIAIGGGGVDAGEHGLRALKKLIVQSHPNGRQVNAVVDDAGALRRPLVDIVHGAQTDGHAHSTSCMNSTTPSIEA
jgi:hypothetical protein